MDSNKCVMCKTEIDIDKDEYDFSFDEEIWCMSCGMQESDC